MESTKVDVSEPINHPASPAATMSMPADYSCWSACYNPGVPDDHPHPDLDRLSSLSALLLLAYGSVRLATLPTYTAEVGMLGLVVPIVVNTRLVMLVMAAALSTLGADWLVGSHPALDGRRTPLVKLVVPGLAAVGIGAFLTGIPTGPAFWMGLPLGAAVLMLAFTAEFYVTDREAPHFTSWSLVLHILAYLLLLEIFFAARATALRSIFVVPVSFTTATAVGWRLLSLQADKPEIRDIALIAGWIAAQLSWGLHYLPVRPIQGAILVTLVLYVTLTLMSRYITGDLDLREAIMTAAVSLIGSIGMAILSRGR